MVERNGWGSAVFSNSGSVEAVSVPGFFGWVVGAEIRGAAWQLGLPDPLLAFSVHAPSRGESYSRQVDKLLDAIGRLAGGRPVVIGGDFNLTVSSGVATDRPVGKRDAAIQARLAGEFGLVNCWREANPADPRHQTLRWTGDRTVPYHCDGLFVPESWRARLRSCAVLSGDEWDLLSDHNPVAACFADGPTPSNS